MINFLLFALGWLLGPALNVFFISSTRIALKFSFSRSRLAANVFFGAFSKHVENRYFNTSAPVEIRRTTDAQKQHFDCVLICTWGNIYLFLLGLPSKSIVCKGLSEGTHRALRRVPARHAGISPTVAPLIRRILFWQFWSIFLTCNSIDLCNKKKSIFFESYLSLPP